MNTRREIPIVLAAILVFVLACNVPGATSSGGTPSASATDQPAVTPGVTYVVVVVNTPTPEPTNTPIPDTPTPQVAPQIILSKNSNCRVGPNERYNVVDQIASDKIMPVIGRNEDSTWWQIVNDTGRECWIISENAVANTDFSGLPIGEPPPLPGTPNNFYVVNQICQPDNKFNVTLSWTSGGGEDSFKLYRDGHQMVELKATKFNYKDLGAPLRKNVVYEIEAVNENGASERATQIVAACK